MYCSNTFLYDEETFNQLTEYYFKYKSYGVNCEIIAYDNAPLDNVFGKQIEFLGIDVANEMAESLLEGLGDGRDIINKHLNAFGLLQNNIRTRISSLKLGIRVFFRG